MDLGSAVDSESKILNFLVQPRQHKMAAIRLMLKRPKQQVVSGHMRLRSDIGTGATCSAAELLVTILSAVFPTIVPSLDAVVTSRATALIVPDADCGIQPAISPTCHAVWDERPRFTRLGDVNCRYVIQWPPCERLH